ncbi:hypothetical protein KR215_008476 [Drosophila sulfurigaster]|nr:hypothetical protein KR215_008476 [Drosophila sulfurigaster]
MANTQLHFGYFWNRHANDDIGGYYHSASGTPDNVVRGRYGSRSPASGQIEETVYTAGPRGFRVNGPKIHRKMDLAQYPVRPRGSPDDPLADPYDDPSYSFKFRTPDQSRSEENDASNRIRGKFNVLTKKLLKFPCSLSGLYSYVDDVGERHSVRYAAGAGTGFEISNAVPDNPAIVGYSSPLYKAHPKTRGKMSVQRGPGGTYKLIAAGPDHRRAESRAPDGLVRGTYSFLDDKGVQRTVEYIAGAGIGYRVVHNRVGPGTHINPSVADFRLSDTDFRLANDFGRGAGGGLGGVSGAGSGGGASSASGAGSGPSGAGGAGGATGSRGRTGGKDYLRPAGGGRDEDAAAAGDDVGEEDNGIGNGNGDGNGAGNDEDFELSGSSGGSASASRGKEDRRGYAAGGGQRGSTRYGGGSGGGGGGSGGGGSGGGASGGSRGGVSGGGGGSRGGNGSGGSRGRGAASGSRGGGSSGNRNRGGSTGLNASGSRNRNRFSGDGGSSESGYLPPTGSGSSSGSGPGDNYNLNDDDVGSSLPPLVTANHRILEIDRDREWVQRHRDSTVIRNVGKWYVGLPPGQSVRAHVQNIDLVPLGGRVNLSPSEALRQDEIAELSASREH